MVISILKLIWCSGHPETYAQLEERGPSAKYGHNVHSAIYETYSVHLFSKGLCSSREGGGFSLSRNLCSVVVFQRSMFVRRTRGLSAKYKHNAHSAMYETYLV